MRQFLIELGTGFAFVGSQVPLEVGGEDFKLDLLFYRAAVGGGGLGWAQKTWLTPAGGHLATTPLKKGNDSSPIR